MHKTINNLASVGLYVISLTVATMSYGNGENTINFKEIERLANLSLEELLEEKIILISCNSNADKSISVQ